MIKKTLIVFLLIYIPSSYSQNLDSLLTAYEALKSGERIIYSSPEEDGVKPAKCALELVMNIRTNFDLFSPLQQLRIMDISQRFQTHTSIVSPGGFFRVHYDTSGVNKPGYDLNLFLSALDSAYTFEIDILGFPPPPADLGMGGDDLYDIYVQDLKGAYYGYTEFENPLGDSLFTTFMVVDNDYSPSERYHSTGISGARVTAAHEFHHAIQTGNYITRLSDSFFYEITSTSMEEFVFDEINDYYAYMKDYFNNPHRSISRTAGGGYDLAIWNLFIAQKFNEDTPGLGYELIKRAWTLMKTNRAVTSIALSFAQFGYSFKNEFNDFGLWTYFTNYRSIENDFFEEAKNYPIIKLSSELEYQPPKKVLNVSSEPVTNCFISFADFSSGFSDTLVSIISNTDAAKGVSVPTSNLMFEYSLMSEMEDGARKINDLYYSKIVSSNNDYLIEANVFNNQPITDGRVLREEIDYSYPQPFNYSRHLFIYLPVSPDPSNEADLNIYSISMDLVYSGRSRIFTNDKIVLQWDGMDNSGNKLPTGVYLYVTKAGDEIKKGKLVIQNE